MHDKINKKMLIIVNVICFIGLFGLFVIKLLMSDIVFWILTVLWLGIIAYTNYNIIVKSSDILNAIQTADKTGVFQLQQKKLAEAYHSLVMRESMFLSMDENSKLRETYETIVKQVMSNIKSAVQYMQTYDYVTCPKPIYLNDLCNNNKILLAKVSELVELVIRIDSTADDVDITEVDDILESLRSVLENEEK